MTDRELNVLPAELSSQLRRLDRRVRALAVLRGLGLVCVVLYAGLAAGLLIDWLFDLGVGPRTAMLLGVGGASLIAAGTVVLRPLIRRTSSAELAALVDTSFPDLRERIESTVELADPDLPDSQKGSELMRSLLMKETMQTARGVDFAAAADNSSAFRWVFVAVLATLLIVLPFGFSKDGYALMLRRFLAPWRNLERATNLYFEIENGDRTAARGDDVTVKAFPRWRISTGTRPDFARLNWQNDDGQTDQRRMDWSATDEAYVATLPHVFSSFDYDVSASRTRTRRFHVDVVERPDIVEFALDVIPPAYTGRAAQTLEGVIGRTEVFERSELTFALSFNKPVESADFAWLSEPDPGAEGANVKIAEEDRIPLELSDDRLRGRLTFEAGRSGPYAAILRDDRGLESVPSVARELVVVADAPPQASWADLDPEQLVNIPPIEARPDDLLPLPVQATDDVGVVDLSLHAEIIQRSEPLPPLAAESSEMGRSVVSYDFPLSLGDFELREGDLLSVRVQALDGRPVPAPQEGWSPARLIRISKDADTAGLQALLKEQQELRKAIEQIRQDVQQDQQQARELEKATARKQQENQPFDRQNDVADLAQREQDVQQRIEQLAAVFDDHPLQTNLADDTQRIADEPIEQAKSSLERTQQAPIGEEQEQLKNAAENLAQADEQLKQLLHQFDELAALERDLQQLEQLAEQADRLSKNVEQFEQDWDDLKQQQQQQNAVSTAEQRQQEQQLAERQLDLQDEQQDLAAALDHLLEERPEIIDAAKRRQIEQLKQLAEQAEQLEEHQHRLAEAMRQESQPTPSSDQVEPSDPSDQPQPPHSDAAGPSMLAERQRQLADDAARQALTTAKEQGTETKAAQAAREFAERARTASEEVQRGLLEDAAASAEQAVQQAEQTVQQMEQADQSFPKPMTQQAETLRQQQADVARQLRDMLESPRRRQAAEEQGQKQISEETDRLARQLDQAAERLGSTPLNEQQAGETAEAAKQSAEQAQSSQEQAQSQIQESQLPEASQPASEAAESLKEAAEQAQQASQQAGDPQKSPVPGQVGEQVTDARRQLEQAGQQLKQAGPQPKQDGKPQESQSGEKGEQNEGQQSGEQPGEKPGEGESPGEGEGQQPGKNAQSPDNTKPGESAEGNEPGQSDGPPKSGEGENGKPSDQAGSQALRDVAESLQNAAEQMGLQRSQRSRQQGKSRQQQSGDSQPGEVSENGDGNGGGLSLSELTAELGRISSRDWGQLPQHVETELQQSQQKKPNGDYARLIRLYFEDVARRQSAADGIEGSAKDGE